MASRISFVKISRRLFDLLLVYFVLTLSSTASEKEAESEVKAHLMGEIMRVTLVNLL